MGICTGQTSNEFPAFANTRTLAVIFMKTVFLSIICLTFLSSTKGQINDTSDHQIMYDSTLDFFVDVVLPITRDTFSVDIRKKIDYSIFKGSNYFYLRTIDGKSKIINIDTLKVDTYPTIQIPDKQYYEAYENLKTCPIGNHKDNLIPYLLGLPTKKGIRQAKRKKIILKGCMGSGEGGQMYYCKIHKVDI